MGREGKARQTGGLSVRRRRWEGMECRKDEATANGRRVERLVKMVWGVQWDE